MADQKLTVNLDANAEQLFDALYNIDQSAKSASKSLKDIEAAGELAAEGIEKVVGGDSPMSQTKSAHLVRCADSAGAARRTAMSAAPSDEVHPLRRGTRMVHPALVNHSG